MTEAAGKPVPRSQGEAVTVNREEELLAEAYTAYNTQNVDALLALVSDHVDWPDGSSRLRGKAAVRAHWTDEWTRTRTHDRPVAVERLPDGRVAVRINQTVRSLDRSVLSTGSFCHVHRIEGLTSSAWTSRMPDPAPALPVASNLTEAGRATSEPVNASTKRGALCQ